MDGMTKCAGGNFPAVYLTANDEMRLRRVAELDIIRWNLLLGPHRSRDSVFETLNKFAGPNYEFCALGFGGCTNLTTAAVVFEDFAASVADMNLIASDVMLGPNQVGFTWTSSYRCPHKGGAPMALRGHVHIFLTDDGLYDKYYDSFDTDSAARQLAECAAFNPTDSIKTDL